MIAVRRLGHATLTTPDLERQVAYYTDVVGLTLLERDKDRAILASRQGLEAIALEPGAPNALSKLSFQVAPGSDLDELTRALAQHGVKAERRHGITPGVAQRFLLRRSRDTRPSTQVSVKVSSPSFSIEVTTLSPGLSHICLSLG